MPEKPTGYMPLAEDFFDSWRDLDAQLLGDKERHGSWTDPEVRLPHDTQQPPPSDVTVLHADGTIEVRPMTDAEYDAWVQSELREEGR